MFWPGKTPLENGEEDKKTLESKFNEILLTVIDEELSSLGEPVKNSLFSHLENNCGIRRNELPQKIEEFSKVLHRFFGLGASRLEIKFMKSLYSQLKLEFEFPEIDRCKWVETGFSFIEYINYMKRNFESYIDI